MTQNIIPSTLLISRENLKVPLIFMERIEASGVGTRAKLPTWKLAQAWLLSKIEIGDTSGLSTPAIARILGCSQSSAWRYVQKVNAIAQQESVSELAQAWVENTALLPCFTKFHRDSIESAMLGLRLAPNSKTARRKKAWSCLTLAFARRDAPEAWAYILEMACRLESVFGRESAIDWVLQAWAGFQAKAYVVCAPEIADECLDELEAQHPGQIVPNSFDTMDSLSRGA